MKVEHQGEKLILAEARLSVLEGEYTDPRDGSKGRELAGLEYERLFSYHPVDRKSAST